MELDEIVSSVKAQLADQARPGVQVEEIARVPGEGPARGGLWWRIPSVTAVFIDLKSSTELNAAVGRNQANHRDKGGPGRPGSPDDERFAF